MDVRNDILELTRFLTELSVIDYFFVGKRHSAVAVAALFNAMELIPSVPDSTILDLRRELRRLPTLEPVEPQVAECGRRLSVLYAQGGYERPEVLPDTETRNDSFSPVCVSFGVYNKVYQQHFTDPMQNEMKNNDIFPIDPESGESRPNLDN